MKDKKKKNKDRDRLKNVGFVENNDKDLDDEDTKSLRSLCFVIDTEKDTLSVISGKHLDFIKGIANKESKHLNNHNMITVSMVQSR